MIHPTADIDERADIADSAVIWHYAQVREGAHIGRDTSVGRGAYIDHHVEIGDRCKIQNYALIYYPAQLDDEVFIGPAAQIINDRFPRACAPGGDLLNRADWQGSSPTPTEIHRGASIGAGAIIFPGVIVGMGAVVGAGVVLRTSLPDMMGISRTDGDPYFVDDQGRRMW